MKRHILFLCMIPALFAACEPEKITDEEILASRTVTTIDVKYTFGGSEVQSLSFGSSPASYPIEVAVNDENLRWTLESDRDWLTVVSDGNRGPGSLTLKVAANENFEDRPTATLTFVAGEYRGFKIKADQKAAAFIVSQPYVVSSVNGMSYECNVTTKAGASWDFSSESWLSVTRGDTKSDSGLETTNLTISVAANGGASRFGRIRLNSGSGSENLSVFQFGSEYKFDSEGRILLDGKASTIEITAPRFMVADLALPSYASYEIADSGDDLSTVKITLSENYNDCSETRQTEVSMRLANSSASKVDLPVIVQDFLPAHGLVTAKGLQAFAAAVASGASTADWETDGVVTMKGDIDMYGVDGWEGIGSEEKPFSGSFDGDGHSVLNLRNSAHGLFGFCQNATVKNVTLGKGSSLFSNAGYEFNAFFGGIVSKAVNSKIEGCGLACDIEFGGPSEEDNTVAYIGGIVGWADKSSVISGARMNGKLTVSSPTASDAICYVGGIAGMSEGTLSTSEVLGQVNFSSGIGTAFVGGIQGSLISGATVSNNSFMGTINLGGPVDNAVIGGLYGRIESDRSFDSASDKSVMLGNINIKSWHSGTSALVYAGGFAGTVAGGSNVSFKGFEAQTNISIDLASAVLVARNVCLGGVLGGCYADKPAKSLSFDGIVSSGSSKTKYDTNIACNVRRLWIGGLAGYINGPATFKDSSNKGEVGKYEGGTQSARSNGYNEICGGIVGYAHGGDVSFQGCVNQGNIANQIYNNNGTTGTWENMYTPLVSGGIIGAFNYGTTVEAYTLTVTSCTNAKDVMAYRGYTGGIVGFCVNAKISGCSNIGRLNNGNYDLSAYRGGIAGAVGNGTVSDCTASCDIYAQTYGSADYACAGGILGIAREGGSVKVEGCSYFGTAKADKKSTDKPEYPGGIVGLASDDTTVSNCKYGGTIQGIEITENNVATNAVGNGKGQISGISYWSGN